jgi:hypothetical protein
LEAGLETSCGLKPQVYSPSAMATVPLNEEHIAPTSDFQAFERCPVDIGMYFKGEGQEMGVQGGSRNV